MILQKEIAGIAAQKGVVKSTIDKDWALGLLERKSNKSNLFLVALFIFSNRNFCFYYCIRRQ